ncbi:MAG: hypothetical protein ABH864_02220 [archaeon]
MRRWAFVVFVVGMFVLMLMFNTGFKQVENDEALQSLEVNVRVETSGEVVSERIIYPGTKLLNMGNGIDVVFSGEGNFLGKEVSVVGRVSEYAGRKQVTAEEVLF